MRLMIIWDNRQRLDSEKSLCSCLFCIATNNCYDHFRKLMRDKKFLRQLIKSSSKSNTVEDAIINKEESGILYHPLDLLPPKRKLVFRLYKVEGKTYEEVSVELGISLSTISDHIVKANLFIRGQLLHASL